MNKEKILDLKVPDTENDLHPLISKRWSPRSFSGQPVGREMMKELLEAARWAPSSYNEQPWQYVYAFRDTQGFDQLWACLSEGNKPWTKRAAVLLVALTHKNLKRNGKPNHWAEHDLGLANAQLLLQAVHRNIYGHFMAGFDQEKVRSLLSLDATLKPVCMGALGYLGAPEELEEPYQSRELSKRSRKAIHEFSREL